jgi:peptidoglycan/xylan/chitin deacetylase (PgdA/CDA1 family)
MGGEKPATTWVCLGGVMFVAAATGACHDEHWMTYPWDDRSVLCSQPTDDMVEHVPWETIEDQMEVAHVSNSVITLHAHIPGETVSRGTIEHLAELAEQHGLEWVTYRDLAEPNPRPRAGIAFAFDDSRVDAWYSVRDILQAHHAKVTLFVTRWAQASDDDRDQLHQLFADGHDVEPHSVMHLLAPKYVEDHGFDAYMTDEFQPSIDILQQDGYPGPAAYAYPFGRDTAELDDAILKVVPHVRVSPGVCPY